jgi:hypothetical protein
MAHGEMEKVTRTEVSSFGIEGRRGLIFIAQKKSLERRTARKTLLRVFSLFSLRITKRRCKQTE